MSGKFFILICSVALDTSEKQIPFGGGCGGGGCGGLGSH